MAQTNASQSTFARFAAPYPSLFLHRGRHVRGYVSVGHSASLEAFHTMKLILERRSGWDDPVVGAGVDEFRVLGVILLCFPNWLHEISTDFETAIKPNEFHLIRQLTRFPTQLQDLIFSTLEIGALGDVMTTLCGRLIMEFKGDMIRICQSLLEFPWHAMPITSENLSISLMIYT